MLHPTLGKILKVSVLLAFAAAGVLAYQYVNEPLPNPGGTIPLVTARFETSLQASITSSATSMTLVRGTDTAGNTLTGYRCFTIDEGSPTAEDVCGTASGTAITNMIRGVDPATGDTEVTALKQPHRRAASVKLTTFSLVLHSRLLNGSTTLPNALEYATSVTTSTLAANTQRLASVAYVNQVATSGAPDGSQTVKGLFEEATQAELAAGTQAGATAADLVAPARYFNATPSATTLVPVTNGSGKIAQGFWDLTQAFSWSGAHTFSATSTFSGTSSFSTSTFSVIPTLPASDPTTDNQAARKAYVDSKIGFYAKGSAALHTATTTETTLASHTITGGAIGANGRLHVTIFWRAQNSGGAAGTQTLRVKYGGTTIAAPTHTSPSGDGELKTEVWLDNVNSASSQVFFWEHAGDNSGTTAYLTNDAGTASVNSASDQTLAITGQLTNTAHDILLRRYTVEITPSS